jgi:hypothetical protein
MIARSFKSVAWVAAIGAAALICYMFSLRGAAERADLVQLNAEVVRLERSIRTLQTELGTRGRIDQLQHWATADFGFTAPVANQFLDGEVTLARFDQPVEPVPMEAPVRMARAPSAAAPAPQPASGPSSDPASSPGRCAAAAARHPCFGSPAAGPAGVTRCGSARPTRPAGSAPRRCGERCRTGRAADAASGGCRSQAPPGRALIPHQRANLA